MVAVVEGGKPAMRLNLLHNLALLQHHCAFSIYFCFLKQVQVLLLHHKGNFLLLNFCLQMHVVVVVVMVVVVRGD